MVVSISAINIAKIKGYGSPVFQNNPVRSIKRKFYFFPFIDHADDHDDWETFRQKSHIDDTLPLCSNYCNFSPPISINTSEDTVLSFLFSSF